ncbi:Uncharacterised protein [Mycobacteroides abscessus subsp. abscessus]|nr:Uncharacterised protein [Mycobacteroides abscessus subsp. abscessus]
MACDSPATRALARVSSRTSTPGPLLVSLTWPSESKSRPEATRRASTLTSRA